MSLIVYMFVTWLKLKKNLMIFLYTISFALLTTSIVASLIYLEAYFTVSAFTYVRPYPIAYYMVSYYTIDWTEILSTIFDVLSTCSFICIWLATALLLKEYKFKIGRIRYYTIILIPLIYYLFPFEQYFGNVLSPIFETYPVSFSIIYALTFSATKQVGALLFSLAFLSAINIVNKRNISYLIIFSAIGITIIFGSVEIDSLRYEILPPFGIITASLLPLGTFFSLLGIMSLAVDLSRDIEIRKELHKNALSQLNFLKALLGVSKWKMNS